MKLNNFTALAILSFCAVAFANPDLAAKPQELKQKASNGLKKQEQALKKDLKKAEHGVQLKKPHAHFAVTERSVQVDDLGPVETVERPPGGKKSRKRKGKKRRRKGKKGKRLDVEAEDEWEYEELTKRNSAVEMSEDDELEAIEMVERPLGGKKKKRKGKKRKGKKGKRLDAEEYDEA